MKSNRWLIVAGVIITICLVCVSILFIGSIISPTSATSTITADISTSIAQTSDMAFTQTALVVPTVTITIATISSPTIIPAPTLTITPTETPVPTATVVIILPTIPQIAACSCAGDTLNCSDFQSQSGAQACMNYCISQSVGDIHNLDGGDGNGLACEGLP